MVAALWASGHVLAKRILRAVMSGNTENILLAQLQLIKLLQSPSAANRVACETAPFGMDRVAAVQAIKLACSPQVTNETAASAVRLFGRLEENESKNNLRKLRSDWTRWPAKARRTSPEQRFCLSN